MQKQITTAARVEGEVTPPGDKSISHRALMISALAEGDSRIENLCGGADITSTIDCLRGLGVAIEEQDRVVTVQGAGLHGLTRPEKTLDVGNSGTTIRLLSGILAGQDFTTKITGDESIRTRPMSRIARPLQEMGAQVSAHKDEFAPLTISGGNLRAIDYHVPVASAQVKSCILLAGLYAPGRTTVHELTTTRDHTELMLARLGAPVQKKGTQASVDGVAQLTARDTFIPGDLSGAAFFIAAALMVPGSSLVIKNVGINPTRRAFFELLCDMGANVDLVNVRALGNEMMADVFVRHGAFSKIELDGRIVPQIIDEIPILAVMATQAEGRTEIRDADELRNKESDRLRSVAFNLQRMGAKVVERPDGLVIDGPVQLKAAEIETFGDHRIAMAFSVAALVAEGVSRIKDAERAQVSYPGFFETLEQVVVARK